MLFWPEISALGVFFNFDNERMRVRDIKPDCQLKVLTVSYQCNTSLSLDINYSSHIPSNHILEMQGPNPCISMIAEHRFIK